jgi:hypothetical protein
MNSILFSHADHMTKMRSNSLSDFFYVIPRPLQEAIKQNLQNCEVQFYVHPRSDHFTASPGPLSPEPSCKKKLPENRLVPRLASVTAQCCKNAIINVNLKAVCL